MGLLEMCWFRNKFNLLLASEPIKVNLLEAYCHQCCTEAFFNSLYLFACDQGLTLNI